ncbi:hypothetical protein RZS08_18760, partial [Arthrospira platensis SPKY1]|nr:hypothetical protein [Arthrospira platensis SPKY1]
MVQQGRTRNGGRGRRAGGWRRPGRHRAGRHQHHCQTRCQQGNPGLELGLDMDTHGLTLLVTIIS